ncbi:hypothetical protein ScalyP_jg11113 [Parmales sp. scaly parma]|nr:hypothetical protein ScalyP_jg11113 [Parmales sp. scaly parma]
MKFTSAFLLVASASAFTTPFGVTTRTIRTTLSAVEGRYGKYDEKLFDNEAKKDVYASWDPSQPRSPDNFNPFETSGSNSPDASGYFPGSNLYKDPMRGEASFPQMMIERTEAEERVANPKAGDVKGAPGRAKGN